LSEHDLQHSWHSEDLLANLSSKPSSAPPPEGLLWGGQGEHAAARKPPEQAHQLKGVFGEGVVAVPDAARSALAANENAAEAPAVPVPVDEELLSRRAQSRGLWTDGGEPPTAPSTQPRATLPRAVVGTPSPASAANSNYRSPSIGSDDQATGPEAPLTAADRSITADTIDIRLQDVKQQVPAAATPEAATRAEPVPPKAAKLPTLRPSASPNTTLWLALILIAAVAAVLFIGAAVGLWSLPWGKPSSGRSSLGKTIPAKSLPEMHTVPPAAAPVVAAAPAPAPPVAAAPSAPVAAQAPSMEADEAAPLRAPTLSGSEAEDPANRASGEVAQLIGAARAELRSGHPKEAEALLRPYLEKNPDDTHVAEALTQALLARGAAVEAVGIAQRIVKKQPKRASYRVLLGDALRRAGDEPSAKLAYKEALALDPKSRDAQRKLKNKPEAKPKSAAPTGQSAQKAAPVIPAAP
jgi:TolA-binding protein